MKPIVKMIRFVLPLALIAAALCAVARPAAAQSMDRAKWMLVESNNVYLDTSTIAPAEGGGHKVWLRALFQNVETWPNRPELRYNAMYYERVYRCDTFEWVTLRHFIYLDTRVVREMPNPFAGHMNNGRDNQEDLFQAVCAHIRARRPAGRSE